MYLLDSCTLSDFMKGDENTILKLKSTPPNEIAISAITQMEIYFGLIRKFPAKHKYFKIFDSLLKSIEIIPFDSDTSIYAAKVKKILEKQGKPIGAYDLLIGATALCHNFTLVSANTKEFSRIPDLRLENWREC